jgi:hypothetical protein
MVRVDGPAVREPLPMPSPLGILSLRADGFGVGHRHVYHSEAMPVNVVRIARNGTRYCYDGLGHHSALSAIMGSTREPGLREARQRSAS